MNADKLSKLLAMASSDNDGEALAALRKAKSLLTGAGMDFKDVAERVREPASAVVQAGQKNATPRANPFAGFDDFMETQEPGWKAKQARARAEKKRREAEQRAAVIAKYGSEEAATLPCERERALNKATAHMRRREPKTFANGVFTMSTLDGWDGLRDMPPSLVEAVTTALPMPATVREARAECEYWDARNREIDAVLGFTGDRQIGLAAQARWDVIRPLYERDMPIASVDDLHVRLDFAVNDETHPDQETMVSILDGFERVVMSADPPPAPAQNGRPARASDRRAVVLDMLSNPDTASMSDRAIARAVGVSPTTVGSLRRSHRLTS